MNNSLIISDVSVFFQPWTEELILVFMTADYIGHAMIVRNTTYLPASTITDMMFRVNNIGSIVVIHFI